MPDEVEPLAQSVLAEALRNADKHAQPTSVRVPRRAQTDGTFVLEVAQRRRERAARAAAPGWACGWPRVEALQRGGAASSSGPDGRATWRVRLVVPLEEDCTR